jgi:hypothetical protein
MTAEAGVAAREKPFPSLPEKEAAREVAGLFLFHLHEGKNQWP